MAARNFTEGQFLQRGVVQIVGGGTGAGNADLTAVYGAGVSSIPDGGTGEYTITLADKYASFLHGTFQVIDATTPDDWAVVMTAEAVATDKTVSITVFKAGTATDLTTDEKLTFCLYLSNTNVPQ
jgi:hypothetical protein